MRVNTLQLNRTVSAVLLVLLLSAMGMTKALAQSFTVGNLNYSVNSDGVSVTVTGHVDGTAATGELVIPESVAQWGKSYAVTVIGNNAFYNCTGFTGNLVIPNSVTTIGSAAFRYCTGFTGNLVIPNSVTTIGDYAFYYCTGFIGNLFIPNSMTFIDSYAFCYCTGFTGNLVIPNSVTFIDSYAFAECYGFTGNLDIPNSVTFIGNYAFKNCTGFNGDLVIPNSVTTIGYNAFSGCTGFTGNLVIPNSVLSIGGRAFESCSGFSSVEYDVSNCADASYDDPPFNNCGGTLIIGENVERIPANMFRNASFTGSLIIPNSVTTIGSAAFRYCTGFTGNLVIPNSVTTIGDYAFYYCSGFTGNLDIPNSVTTIGSYAFYNCSGFTGNLVIPNSVTTIGSYAFYNCSGFTGNLVIPNSVTTIDSYAFYNCSGFTGNLDIPNSVTFIGGYAFYNCSGFTGNLVIPNSVTTIGSYAFSHCYGFTGDLIIPNSVTFIGGYAFSGNDFYSVEYNATNCADEYPEYPPFHGCDGTLVIGENVERIPANMFMYAAFTGSLIIPNSVTSIGNHAFYHCSGFTGNLVIPNSVTSIGNSAFDVCTGFYSVEYNATNCADASLEYPPFQSCGTQLIIGENVEHIPANMFRYAAFTLILSHAEMPPTIGTDAFYGIFNGISVYVPCGSLSDYQNAEGWNEFTNIFGNSFEITVGDLNYYVNCDGTTVTVTGHVDGQSATGELVIPKTVTYNGSTYSVTAIRNSAFSGCSGFTGNLVIPNSVTTIGSHAFYNCSGFTGNLVIPNSVTTIGSSAFYECTGFTGNLVIPNSVTSIGNCAFYRCTGFNGNLVIPNSVTTIGNDAFYNCFRFTGNLVIPNSVTTIGGDAFYNCSGFTGNLVIPNSVTSIGNYAFYRCTGFTGNLVIPNSVTSIGNCAFYRCTGFTGNLVIPNSVTTIEDGTFSETSFTGNLVIPNSVTTIGSSAFYECTGFTGNLVIPNSVTTIGSSAFYECTGFTGNLVIPNSVTTIGSHAFYNCSGFTGNLVIPNSVTEIGIWAFYHCSGFTGNLVIPNSVTTIGRATFYNCNSFSFVEYNATDCADASLEYPPFHGCGGTLVIGENVERIPANMFRNAAFPLILSHAEMPPTVATDAFYGIDHDIPVYVPCGSLNDYQNAGGWNEFNNIFECFEIKEIMVTVSPANSGTVTGAGTYELGTTCTLTATANPGYTFNSWKENGNQVSFDANYSFTVTGDRNLVANFALFTITATTEPADGGTVSGAGEYYYNSTCTLTATPAEGYTFINWTENGEVVSVENPYTFTVTGDRDLVANFAINLISQVVVEYYPDANNPASPNVRVQWNYIGDSVAHHFRIYRAKCDDSSPYISYILMTNEEYNNWFVDTTWNHIAGGNYKYGVSCVYEDGKEGGINWSIYNKNHDIPHEIRPSRNNYPVEGSSTGRAPYCIIPENTNLPIFRNQNTDCIIAQNGTDFGHFALNNPSEVTPYGFTIDEFTNGACFMNGTYYFSTNNGIFGTINSESGLTVIATGRPFGQIEYNPVDGKLYGLSFGSNATLYDVNPFDGSYTAIAIVPTSYALTFTITNEGRFIVCDMGDDCIKEYDLAMGELTPLICVGWDIGYGQDMAMDRETNEVYWAAFNASDFSAPLIKIDFSNNTLSTIGYFENQVAAFANATTHLQGYPPVWSNCIENVLSLCSLTIEMYDSWGDGWNGNKLTVSDDFGDYYEVTLDNGSSGSTTLPIPDGSHITLGWIMGNYTSECSFNVRYPNGDLIYHGENMGSNFSFEFDIDCPATMFTISAIANPVEGGTVTGAGTYDYGTSVTIAATANVGYIFNNWAEEGEVVSTDESYTFIITDDHDFVANFTINTYNVTVAANPTDGGTVAGGGTYNHGVTATLTATANIGYTFVNWMENGEVVSTDAEYSFTVTGDRDLVANFSQNTYTISALAIPSNGGSVSGAGNYYYGDTCTLTATPNTGFSFVHWTKNGTHVSTNATYSFTVTENASCVAYFRVTSYTISASANPTEGGTVTGAGTYNHGSTCTLTATANEGYTFVNWTENGTEVSTNAIYSFTVTGNRNLVSNFTSDSGGYYWTVNVNQYPNTMTAIGVILIDDVEQMTSTLELGAFCGTECRGRERLAYISQMDRYLLFLTMYGENGDVLNFRLYDHALGQELDVICTNSVTFATNNTLGTVVSPYEFSFMEGIQTQTSSLPEGWSWWSTYIEQEGIDGLTQLENSLGENGVMIKSQSEGFTSRYGEFWFGLLNSINNESSYLVQTSGSCDVSLTGHVAVPSEHPITLLPGWTWIGYPNNTAMSVSTALSNLNPSENDMLKAQESFSVYYPSIGWFGSLQTIMPGMGLMYESHNTSSVTLTYSNPTRSNDLAENVTARANHWNPDVYAYPNNMNVMAVVEVNGEELQSEDYELAAFASGECRGSAKLMYVEQLHRYMAFLTLHGDDEAELSFGLYDNATGMTAYKSDARLIFAANAVAGSPDNPMVVSFSDITGIDSFGGTLHVFPNPVERGSMITIGTVEESDEVRVEIMNAVGAVLFTETSTKLPANIKAPEVPGVYMLRITSKGRGIRYVKLIVS